MTITPSVDKKSFRTFSKDDKGSVAMILALIIVPLMIMIGFAIDFLRATNYRSKAAEALDIALLMTAQQYAYDKTIDVSAKTQANFNANWVGQALPPPTITAQVLPDNNIKGTISSTIPTTFMQIIGHDQMPIDVVSQVTANTKNLELVLVLDNTGSMDKPGKIDTLKTAASDLVTTVMANNGATNNVKVGIAPFSRYVNVGIDKAGKNWLKVPAPSCYKPLIHPEQCSGGTSGTPTTCYDNEGNPYACTTGGSNGTCPPSAYGSEVCKTWDGCVGSRDVPHNTEDDIYTTPTTKIPGIITWGDYACPKKVTPLTDSQSTILNNISAMNADGATYIPHGLMWGWRLLSDQEPFDQGEPYTNTKVTKVMVLMTDGENTRYPSYPYHNSAYFSGTNNLDPAKTAISNGLTATACTNIKAKGIKIYTVAFQVTDAPTKSMLETCASDPENYYDATSATALTQAFRDITLELINLRVAK